MRRLTVSSRAFFYTIGFSADAFNFAPILAESFLASSRFHATEMEMGILGAANALGYALPCMMTGLMSERVGRRRMCAIAAAGILAVNVEEPFLGSVRGLCVAGFLRMFATGFLWPPLMAWFTETTGPRRFSRFLGGYNVSWAAGILVGFLVGGWTYQRLGAGASFGFGAVFSGALLVALFAFDPRPEPDREGDEPVCAPPDAAAARNLVILGLLLLTCGCFLSSLVLYLFPKLAGASVSEEVQSRLHVLRMAGQVAAFFVLTHTVAWHNKRWPMTATLLAFAAGIVLASAGPRLALSAPGFALLGVGNGIAYMLSAYYALALVKTKGLGSGLQETLIGTGYLLGPLYGGALATIRGTQWAVVAGLLPVALLALVVARTAPGRVPTRC